MTDVIVCGPISSGTRMLTKIVQSWGVDAEHRSMPHWDYFWSTMDPAFIARRYVIITRRPDISIRSAYRQGHGNPALGGVWAKYDHRLTLQELHEWWKSAIGLLAQLQPAYWTSYEAWVADPQIQAALLADWLKIEGPAGLPFTIRDENEKWLAELPF